MAFQYRTPTENVLSKFTSEEQSRINNSAVNSLAKLEKKNHDFFNYHLSEHAKMKLTERGLYLSPLSYQSHSHPVCKTIENHLLLNVLPNQLDDEFFIVSIKDNKLNYLRNRSKLPTLKALNRFVVAKDITRYGLDTYIEKGKKDLFVDSDRDFDKLGIGIRDLVPQALRSKARKLFLYDELHYWSLKDLDDFLCAVKPACMIATHIFPKEILAGQSKSMNDWVYKFDINDDRLTFFPDGCFEESYEQPLNGGRILMLNGFKTSSGDHYSITVTYSLFAHSVIQITKGELKTEESRYFSGFEATNGPEICEFGGNLKNFFPVGPDLIKRIYLYLRTLKKPDIESAMAKLRQSVENATGSEIIFVENFATFLLNHKTQKNLIEESWTQKIQLYLMNLLPTALQRNFESFFGCNLAKFIENLEEAYVKVDCFVGSKKTGNWEEMYPDIPTYLQRGLKLKGENYEAERRFARSMYASKKSRRYSFIGHELEFNRDVVINFEIHRFINAMIYRNHHQLEELKRILVSSLLQGFLTPEFIKKRQFFYLHAVERFGLIEFASIAILRINQTIDNLRSIVPGRGFLIKFESEGEEIEREEKNKRRTFFFKKTEEKFKVCDLPEMINAFEPEILETLFELSESRAMHGESSVNSLNFSESRIAKKGDDEYEKKTNTVFEEEVTETPESSTNEIERHIETEDEESMINNQSGGVDISREEFVFCRCGLELKIVRGELKDKPSNIILPDSSNGRLMGFYSRDNGPQSYNYGRVSHESLGWNSWLDEILLATETDLSDYDSCLVQKYEKYASLPFHSDNEKCYPEGNKILTVNLRGIGVFSVSCKCGSTSFKIADNEWFIMPAGMQETHKHKVECLTDRISLTFRNTKSNSVIENAEDKKEDEVESWFSEINFKGKTDDFHVIKLKAVQTISTEFTMEKINNFNEFPIPGDGNCFWHCITCIVGRNPSELKEICRNFSSSFDLGFEGSPQNNDGVYAEEESIFICSAAFAMNIVIFDSKNGCVFDFKPLEEDVERRILMKLENEHFTLLVPKEGCVVKAIALSLGRDVVEVLKVLSMKKNQDLLDELNLGKGLPTSMLHRVFKVFGIRAIVNFENGTFTFNEAGKLERKFSVTDSHMVFNPKTSTEEVSHFGVERVFLKSVDASQILFSASDGSFIDYNLDYSRALLLQESFLAGNSGKILSETYSDQKPWLSSAPDLRTIRLYTCLGTFGSGKSYSVKKMIKSKESAGLKFVIISPRRVLAELFKKDLDLKGSWNSKEMVNFEVLTFEVALKKKLNPSSIVIFDEMQLFPPGYLDLIVLYSKLQNVLILGDPAQSNYDSEQDRHVFEGVNNDLIHVLQDKEYKYLITSRRFRNSLFINRLPCKFDKADKFAQTQYTVFPDLRSKIKEIKRFDAILCCSFDEKKSILHSIGKGSAQVLTFGESTGLTFRKGCILLTQNVARTDERRVLTALSRFSEEINFINFTGEDFRSFIQSLGSGVLFNFCTEKASLEDLKQFLPGEPKFMLDRERIGKDEQDRELRMAGDPWLKEMIFIGQREVMAEETTVNERFGEERALTHHPLPGNHFAEAVLFDRIKDKMRREVRMGASISEQFRDSYHSRDSLKKSNQCDLFESIYPRHNGTDSVTFMMAVRKRLTFADPNINEKKMKSAIPFGKLMFEHFMKFVPLKDGRNDEMLRESKNEFEVKKLQKSAAMIENHNQRSNRDWPIKEAFIFMKSQLCTKFEKRFVEAKAGQTLACFSHIVLARFAPWIRYIEKKVLEVLPPNFYIHSGKNFDQLEDWVKKNDFSHECTESDYEAFDASQDATILAFELELMSYLKIPKDVIDDYIYIKLNLSCKTMLFAIMRFTGEAGTFLFNSLANMCFTFMRYKINGSEAIAFAGDDMCANTVLKITNDFEKILSRMKLKAKVEYKHEASFCGWTLGDFGIYKKPQLVYERFRVAMEKGTLHECIDNYALEISYGYRMGDKIFEHMSEEEVEYQNACIRIIVQNARLIKSNALDYFNGVSRRKEN